MKTWKIVSFFCIVALVAACRSKPANLEHISEATVAMLDSTRHTTMEWKDTEIRFGTVKEGDTVRMVFDFTNTGNQPLFITEVKPSCGCTIADYPTEPVLPGKSGTIKALFATEWHPGAHRKMIFVRANTKPITGHKLIFTGEVLPQPKQKKF